jgi:NAD(P)-dependent dehydrogenase (short-subunit alcohol dehydrogenase family)
MNAHSARFSLEGQAALVIGGTSGIGLEIAIGLHQAGARVAIVGRSPAKLAAAVQRLKEAGATPEAIQADIVDPAALERVVCDATKAFGAIDILVNSQGTTTLKAAEDMTREDYAQIMDTNMTSVYFACTRVGRDMLARGSGAIVNIASLAAHRGMPLSSPYTVSKHGVLGLTRALASEWATRGVRVNAISPGFFMTALNRDKMRQDRKESALRRTPARRFGDLEELVGAAVFLASPAARFVNGQTIAVDGGFLAAGLDGPELGPELPAGLKG